MIGGPTGVSAELPACCSPSTWCSYQIAQDPDDPTLLRSGGAGRAQFANTGVNIGGPTGAGTGKSWRAGSKTCKVEYFRNGAWGTTPGVVFCDAPCSAPAVADFNRVVRQVRVTLLRALDRPRRASREGRPRLAGPPRFAGGSRP